MMEMELEPGVKPLAYKVKAMSRESPAQKATHVLDTDLRNHWSTGTNTKEWILLELDEPCLLSQIRIYNKSVLEWEISVGLRYKPETFVKIRPRCEAPRRDMTYPTNYTPCRYVRISCMRGNPIALFFIQLIGIPVPGLEPEFQPVANHLLPHIMSHKQDAVDMHLQLLQDVTSRLTKFLPHLEADLNSFAEAAESTMRLLAMLAGPFYPILQIVSERETARLSPNTSDHEAIKTNPSSTTLMVSSNFEPRRSRNTSSVFVPMSVHVVFRPDVVFLLLRKACRDSNLGNVCRMASRIFAKLVEPMTMQDASSVADETPKYVPCDPIPLSDYSDLFGEEFRLPDDSWDPAYLNVLDSVAVEEGLMHVLYASTSEPSLCSKLSENNSDLWVALPLVQALLPALRPNISSPYQISDSFSPWKQSFVQTAVSQIVATSSSTTYNRLLHACAGYLASFSPSHVKAACVLIDLCSGVLSPWMAQVVAKVDLTVELLEDLLGVIQGARVSLSRARAALKYIVLALSGNMDDIMEKYKEGKHQILFLVEMLEPFLDPCLTPLKGMIAFGNVSSIFIESQERNCAIALNVIHTAIRKSSVLPSLEAEWRHGSVAPSVLLSVLDAQMQLPNDIDERNFSSSSDSVEPQSHENSEAEVDATDKPDFSDDASLLFAPTELNRMSLVHIPTGTDAKNVGSEVNNVIHRNVSNQFPDVATGDGQGSEFINVVADYSQLMNYRDCELRASEFRRLALHLSSRNEITRESHDVAIDALLLAADCYINPSSTSQSFKDVSKIYYPKSSEFEGMFRRKDNNDLKLVGDIERKRDRVVLEILIEAAELDRRYHDDGGIPIEGDESVVNLSKQDILSADAVTLVRQNQSLVCSFLIKHLQKQQHPRHEILMWCLLFLLQSATKLTCVPEHVVNIILNCAESFNMRLKSGNSQLKQYEVKRHWILLQRLVVASSGGNDERSNGFRFSNLIPPSSWLEKVPVFSSSIFPIVRYFGWMAISRNAKQFLKDRLFLVSDLPQVTYLLSIFSDDLSLVDNIKEDSGRKDGLQSFHVLYPDISKFFPNLRNEFVAFGETILEAIGLQLKFLTSSVVPDLMCWFSDLCSWPFVVQRENPDYFKGYVAKNAKAVILYVLEAIISEHMEAMVPEIPRVVHVLISLCTSSYCDVSFLDSILSLLKPIIAYSLENQLPHDSCDDFESLCFGELFKNIRYDETEGTPVEKGKFHALMMYVLATVFGDLSFVAKTELLQSSVSWAEFASFAATDSFRDYICAYQVLMDNCRDVLITTSRARGIVPSSHSDTKSSLFLSDVCDPSSELKVEEVKPFSMHLEALVLKLNPTLEQCWILHRNLSKKLALTCAECFVYSRCLSASSEVTEDFWKNSLEALSETILALQEKHCWEVASVLLDSLLGVPDCFCLDGAISNVCAVIKNFSNSAPNISLRLQTDKMISLLLGRGIRSQDEEPIVDLFYAILGHPEPEQRYIAIKHLGRLIGQDVDGGRSLLFSTISSSDSHISTSESVLSRLISATWDHVALMASSDTSLLLRTHATALLISFVPFVERHKLQSFLAAADTILQCLTTLPESTCYGPLTQFSLALVASVCLYAPFEDISLIPESIWRNIETFGTSTSDRYCTGFEKKACDALCRIKSDGDEAKLMLKEVLSLTSPEKQNPDFVTTRESILQVIGNLTSARSYFDFFSTEADEKTMELEEAEIEIELVQKEHPHPPSSDSSFVWRQLPFNAIGYANEDDKRLARIRDGIKSLEKAKLREEVVARRQQKLLARRARQQFLEEAALREAELIQKLDRERRDEVEKKLERQHELEVERAKTRELQHNLDLEKEKQAQRELQRELEQVESGIRPSRREYASSAHASGSRARDKYRERENSRESNERATSRSGDGTSAGRGSFSGQPPMILQSRDRSDESYEETFDGSKDSGDTGSVGDPDLVSTLEGQYTSSQRRGSTRSRQVIETRRERGGKWERKH